MFQATDSVDNTNSVHHWNHSNLEFWGIAWLDRAVEDFCKTWFKKQNRGLSLDFGSSGEFDCFVWVFFPPPVFVILSKLNLHTTETPTHIQEQLHEMAFISMLICLTCKHTRNQAWDAKRRDFVEKEDIAKRLSPCCMKVWQVTLPLEGFSSTRKLCSQEMTKILLTISQVNQFNTSRHMQNKKQLLSSIKLSDCFAFHKLFHIMRENI